MKRGRTVILAAGAFPRKGGAAWTLLESAARVVACDSAANAYRRRFRRWPTVVVGDLDSFVPTGIAAGKAGCPEIVRVADQDTNDLEKAFALCRRRGWKNPVVVGATGKREDHAIGNVFRALDAGCEVVTDAGRFVPFRGRKVFRLKRGTPLSVFAPNPETQMASSGLEWPLDGVVFGNLYCATLNRTTSARVVLTSSHRVCAYLPRIGP